MLSSISPTIVRKSAAFAVIHLQRARSNIGFTLVELMVVVAILGVLASIATTNYQKVVGRARQSEAKIQLANLYTSLQSFYTEQGSFTLCLYQAGFEPNPGSRRYYTVGFMDGAPDPATCGPTGTSACNVYEFGNGATCNAVSGPWESWGGSQRKDGEFLANAWVRISAFQWNPQPVNSHPTLPGEVFNQNSYIAVAYGSIANSSVTDVWTINQSKSLLNHRSGL